MTNLLEFQKVYQGANLLKDCYVGDTHVAHMHENLLTNPSFETGGSLLEVRRNLARNPSFETDLGFTYMGLAAGAALTRDTTSPLYGSYSMRVTVGSDEYLVPTRVIVGSGIGTNTMANLTAGEVYTMSLYVRPSVAMTLTPAANYRDAAGSQVDQYVGVSVACPANVWTRLSLTSTAPAGATRGGPRLMASQSGGTQVYIGDTIDTVGYMVEKSPVLGAYFDGAVSLDADLTPSWTGTAHASESIASGSNLPDGGPSWSSANTGQNQTVGAQSSRWSVNGGKSIRVIPVADQTDTAVQLDLDSLGLVTPGKTYTFRATMSLPAALTGGLNARARSILLYNDVDGWGAVDLDQAPNTPGVYELSITKTIPVGATDIKFRLYHGGAQGSGEVMFDNVAIFEGAGDIGYFDGDAPPKVRRNLFIDPAATAQKTTAGVFLFAHRWFGSGATAGTHSYNQAGSGIQGGPDTYVRKQWSAVGGYQDIGFGFTGGIAASGTLPAVTPGETYVISCWMRTSWQAGATGVGAKQNRIRVSFFDRKGVFTGSDVVETDQPFPAPGEWQFHSVVATVPEGTEQVSIVFSLYDTGVNHAPGDYLDFTGGVVEKASQAGPYFSGSQSPGPHLVPVWEGAENASPSYLYDKRVSSGKPFWTGAAHASTSKLWGAPA